MKIVKKVWGEEHWIVNRSYCGKRLLLRGGFRSSIHCHRVKEETFYLLSGRMLLEAGSDPGALSRRLLAPGDVVDLLPGTWHRFSSLEDAEFIEFSTHHDDADSHRVTSSERIPEDELRRLREAADAAREAAPAPGELRGEAGSPGELRGEAGSTGELQGEAGSTGELRGEAGSPGELRSRA